MAKTKLMPRDAKANNVINILHPYRTNYGGWVYDDPDIGVFQEAFVMGSSEVIDHLVGEDTTRFQLLISSKKIPKHDAKIVKIKGEEDGWYQLEGTDMQHWLCGCVLDYFPGYPDEIYIKIQNKVK